ncbi:MAG TPA: ABC transporter permease [Firmicutes bacterium]|nr:ABC transporter permease [Bacillota bacterium]
MRRGKLSPYCGLIIPGMLVGLWLWAGYTGRIKSGLFPTLPQVGEAALIMGRSGELWNHITSSLTRVVCGWFAAVLVGVPLGLMMGCSRRAEAVLGPAVHFLRQIPPVAWIPLFLVWLGIGELSKFAVIFYAAVGPVILNTSLGVQSISQEFWEVARVFCLGPWTVLKRLIWPGSRKAVYTGLRVALGLSWRALVAAEMLAGSSGLGYLVMSGRVLVRVDEMLVGVLCIGFIGLWIEWVFGIVESRLSMSHEVVTGHQHTPAPIGERLQEV